MTFRVIITAIVSLLLLTGFGTAPKSFDQGYGDGYAVGYNTTCRVRGTYLNADWDSPAYRDGYATGLRAGVRACLRGTSAHRRPARKRRY